MRRRRQPEVIAGRVNADGSIAAGDGFTVQKTGTGVYVLTFASGFRLLSCSVSAYVSVTASAVVQSERTVQVAISTTSNNTFTASDQGFNVVAVGVQT